jgi:multifunctional methyltransferase subunit TRM112
MKVITANFVTCSVKECKTSPSSFPLHFHDAELEMQELDFQPEFIRNVIPRIDWEGLRVTANEVPLQQIHAREPS